MNKIIKNLKGTIDLFNNKIIYIDYIIKTIIKILKLYGYQKIETPSLENLEIINKIKRNINNKLYFNLNKKFLIFDLTIPLIRFILTNNNRIIYPFKRYQIQKVWRGEKPQKNRYREFYQLDYDIVNFKSTNIEELEIILICNKIFKKLNLPIYFLINHKDIIYGICEKYKINNKYWNYFINTIDKIEKLGINLVKNLLIKKININIVNKILKLFNIKKKNIKLLKYLKKKFKNNKNYGINGINKLLKIFNYIIKFKIKYIKVKFMIYLSRGLDYYSDIYFEIKSIYKNNILSLGGGGRYNNIIKINNKNIKFIGISLGIYRIYNIIKKYKFKNINNKKIMLINFNKNLIKINKYAEYLRKKKFITEIYLYNDKIKKQLKYCIKKKYNYLIFIGTKEIRKKIINVKNIYNNKNKIFNNIKEFINYIKKKK